MLIRFFHVYCLARTFSFGTCVSQAENWSSAPSTVQGNCVYTIFKAENQEIQFPLLCTKPSIGHSLLYGATEKSLNKLQIVQNKLARVVFNVTTRQQHTIDLFHNLHWLPIRSRITLKVATLCYKAYWLNQPSYLLDTLESYVPCRGLRSVDMDLLTVPRSRIKTAARHSFSSAPTVWNGLPLSICNTDSIVTF